MVTPDSAQPADATHSAAGPGGRKGTEHRFRRRLLAVTAVGWASFALLLGLLSVLPIPPVEFWTSLILMDVAFLVQGYSLVLAAFTVLGLGLAALAHRSGLRKASLVATVLAVVTLALSLVPVVLGWRSASQEDVPLSLAEYFSFPSLNIPVETVTYARPDGEELLLDIRQPAGEAGPGPRPAIVTVHGGGGVTGSRTDDILWSAWLAEQGYVVFSIDYRLGHRPFGQEATADVKCAVGWVEQNADRYGVNPDRIALLGHSAGGLAALLAAYTGGDPQLAPSCEVRDTDVEAVISFYAATDQTGLDAWRPPWWLPSLGADYDPSGDTAGSDEEPYFFTTPTSHVDPADPPTLLVQGGADQITPPDQAQLLANRLEEEGVPHRLVQLPWARHGFDGAWGGWDAQIVRHEVREFLENELPN